MFNFIKKEKKGDRVKFQMDITQTHYYPNEFCVLKTKLKYEKYEIGGIKRINKYRYHPTVKTTSILKEPTLSPVKPPAMSKKKIIVQSMRKFNATLSMSAAVKTDKKSANGRRIFASIFEKKEKSKVVDMEKIKIGLKQFHTQEAAYEEWSIVIATSKVSIAIYKK